MADDSTGPSEEPALKPGRLTAGAINDWPDHSAYREFIEKLPGTDEGVYKQFAKGTFELTFTSASGKPLANANITVNDPKTSRSIALRTRTDGRIIVSPKWDKLASSGKLDVTVQPLRGPKYMTAVIPGKTDTHHVRVPRTPDSRPIEQIQLALVLDCTGSMGDELKYLKVELKAIAEAIAKAYPGVEQRYALVAYRDKDDEYATRTIDFTHGLNEFIAELAKQSANGGGDTPEAVERAYSEADALSWADGRVARVALHVADAPPHDENQETALRHLDGLRAMGVAVYPIASSGSDQRAQFTMRTAAMLTGGQYLFLTDDSGIGNSHSEPTETTGYSVMPLRDHVLRIVASEIAGHPIKVEAGKVIRRVEK